MDEQLAPYQLEGAAFLAGRTRAAIFDEPGLGKTAQAIRAREVAGAKRALIICPAGVRQVWPYQIKLWGRDNARVLKADSIFDLVAWQREKCDVLVMSYEQATMWREDICSDFFDALIIDESHYLKNPQSKRAQAIIGETGNGSGAIAGWAERTWCLTGTPIKNDPADLWVPLRLAGVTREPFTKFVKRYFSVREKTFSLESRVRKETLPELQHLIHSMSILRTFDDVGEQLPPIRLDTLPVDGESSRVTEYLRQFPGLSERIIEALEREGKVHFDDGTHVATLRSLIGEAKAVPYAQMIIEELKSGTIDKLVVMAVHQRAIQIVCTELRKAGINAEMIYGPTSEKDRTRIVRSFQDDPNGVRVIVGNIQAAGTGLTMTAACRLDMLESSWTPADNVQAVRRIRRKGQTRPTLARFVMLNNSFDAVVARVVARKANAAITITGRNTLEEALAS